MDTKCDRSVPLTMMETVGRRRLKSAVVGTLLLGMLLGWVPRAEAGDYQGRLVQVYSFRWNGQGYVGFWLAGYDWAVPSSDPLASLLTSTAGAAMVTQSDVYVGCRSCSSIVATPFNSTSPRTFWVPDYLLLTAHKP